MAQVSKDAHRAGGTVCYQRHRPETTLLYQLVEEYYPAFAAQMAAQGTLLPKYVQRKFEVHRWTSHSIVDTLQPHFEACSYASGLIPPR